MEVRQQHLENTIHTAATAEQIWRVWTDVNNWTSWDPHALEAKLKGEFVDGSSIYYKPKDAPAGDNALSGVVPNKQWITTSSTPFGKLVFTHTITDNGASRAVTEHMDANGLIAPLFKRIWAKKRVIAGEEILSALVAKAATIE
ncbi:MAG: SRPBCC family protein [Herpetosiphonaceae bacterium]|nr:SRPBCC family protein [Herpetosiphonaceae bacterium]